MYQVVVPDGRPSEQLRAAHLWPGTVPLSLSERGASCGGEARANRRTNTVPEGGSAPPYRVVAVAVAARVRKGPARWGGDSCLIRSRSPRGDHNLLSCPLT